jgi:hypothetical protein
MGRGICVDPSINGASAEPSQETQPDHNPPLERQRIAQQTYRGRETTECQESANVQAREQVTTAEAGAQIAHGKHHQERAERIEREMEKRAYRRPGNSQQPIGQAQADKADIRESNEQAT